MEFKWIDGYCCCALGLLRLSYFDLSKNCIQNCVCVGKLSDDLGDGTSSRARLVGLLADAGTGLFFLGAGAGAGAGADFAGAGAGAGAGADLAFLGAGAGAGAGASASFTAAFKRYMITIKY